MGLQRVGHDWTTNTYAFFSYWRDMFFCFFFAFFPSRFFVLLPVLIAAFLSLLRNIPLYSYSMSWVLFCFYPFWCTFELFPIQLFKIILLIILFYMSFGVHKYSSFLSDMYQEWNYWVLGNFIFGFSDRLPKTFARVAIPISTLTSRVWKLNLLYILPNWYYCYH